ncbi:unnamed protein product [Calicophoron daubneyi]|uniref:Uncharacterized protein n=1 Tax=Calicophoron daubneyi TaxID=300641 RepID=A0AAV2TJB0_CALDB
MREERGFSLTPMKTPSLSHKQTDHLTHSLVVKFNGQRDVAATPEPPTTGVESSPEHQPMADTSQEHPDDWQSVSEEPDGTQKKPDREVEEADRESWSSATEEPDIQPKADGVSTESLKVSQEEQPQEQESVHGAPQHTELDEQADTSVIAEKPGENEPAHEITEPVVSTPPAAHTKAEKHENQSKHSSFPRFLDFSEWGKAIRRCYQEEENREKAMSAKEVAASHSFSPETEEPRSSLSGYEADQEDNVMSKSSITSPLSHTEKTDVKEGILEQSADQSTAPEPGETAFISSELVDKKEQGCKEDLPGRDVESDSAPPADTAIPNHGLFAGHGWPGMKSEPEKNPLSDLISNVPVCETVTEPSQAETNLDTSGGDWASVMAGIYDRTGEPSTWSHGLDQPVCFPHSPVTPDLTIPPGEEVHPETTHAPKDNLQDLIGHHTNKPGEVSDDELKGYHGLFAGHGWPSKKHGSSKGREESPKLGTEHPGHEAGESELPSSQMEISKSPVPPEPQATTVEDQVDLTLSGFQSTEPKTEESALSGHMGGGHGSLGRKHRSGKKKGRSPKVSGSDYETHRGSPFPGVALVGMEEQEVNVPSELQQASEVPLPPEDMSSAKEVEETHVPQKSDEEREIPIETFEKPEEEKEIPIEVEPSEAKEVTDMVVPSLWEADVQKEETELGDHLGGGHGSLGRKHRSGKKKGRSPKVSGSDYETHRESPMPESEKPKSAEAEADFPVEFELSSRSPLVPDAFKSTLADEGKISPWEKESHTPDTPSDEHVTVGDEKHPVPTMPTQEPAVNDWNSGFGAFYGGSPGGHVWKTDEKELAELKQQMERSEDNLNVPSSVTETERVPVNETGSQAVTGIMNDVQPETEESEEHMRKLESLSDSIKPQVELDLSIAPGGEGQSVENLTERSTVLEEVSKPADQQTAISTSSPTPVAAETAPAVTVISKVAEDKKETEDITIHPLGDQPVDLNAPKVTVSGAGVNDDKTGTLKSKKKKSRRKPKKKT